MSDSKIFVVTSVTGGGEDGRGQYNTSRLYFTDRSAAHDVCTCFNGEGGRSLVSEEPIFTTVGEYMRSLPVDVMTSRFPNHPETRKVLELRRLALAKLSDEDKRVLGL
jgi:hypothetical protein